MPHFWLSNTWFSDGIIEHRYNALIFCSKLWEFCFDQSIQIVWKKLHCIVLNYTRYFFKLCVQFSPYLKRRNGIQLNLHYSTFISDTCIYLTESEFLKNTHVVQIQFNKYKCFVEQPVLFNKVQIRGKQNIVISENIQN